MRRTTRKSTVPGNGKKKTTSSSSKSRTSSTKPKRRTPQERAKMHKKVDSILGDLSKNYPKRKKKK